MHVQLLSIIIMIARESTLQMGQKMIVLCLSFGGRLNNGNNGFDINKTKVKLKLTGQTSYYVRVRYVGADGVSAWSKVKKATAK